jgi:hypothetical protein
MGFKEKQMTEKEYAIILLVKTIVSMGLVIGGCFLIDDIRLIFGVVLVSWSMCIYFSKIDKPNPDPLEAVSKALDRAVEKLNKGETND